MSARRCRVLFVDDSEDDHVLFRSALRRGRLKLDLLPPLHDGVQALAYLTGEGAYADRTAYPLPDLMVLDLKMPVKTGHEVLAWLRTHPSPPTAVVFSASSRDQDVSQANTLGARNYFIKPGSWEGWLNAVVAIAEHCPLRAAGSRPQTVAD